MDPISAILLSSCTDILINSLINAQLLQLQNNLAQNSDFLYCFGTQGQDVPIRLFIFIYSIRLK